MGDQTITVFFSLIRSAICGDKLNDEEKKLFSCEQLQNMVKLAKKHDILHLLALGLKQNGLMSEEVSGIEKSIYLAVYRYEQLNHEYERTCQALEAEGIPFMPLKGSVIRGFYPEAWMRTSYDIDILVREEDLQKAASVLEDKCGYVYQKKGSHEIVFVSGSRAVIELHFSLIEDGRINNSAEVLNLVWETACVRESCCYWYYMSDEMFYFYHIAHLAKHLKNGGCGIKPFMDLWILSGHKGFEPSKSDSLLEKGGLLKLSESAEKLAKMWFENGQKNEVLECLEEYILKGGVYGTKNNAAKIKAANGVSKTQSFLELVFLSKKNLEKIYPNLKKRPLLFPFYQVKRWFRVFRKDKRNKIQQLTEVRNAVSKEDVNSTAILLEHIGLK